MQSARLGGLKVCGNTRKCHNDKNVSLNDEYVVCLYIA